MSTDRIVRVGSRKSELALIQTRTVIDQLRRDASLKFETITMHTTGDKILDSALSKIGEKSLFTRELEDALLKKKVDFVVHSLKDLPTQIPPGLVIGAVLKRDNPHDAVVMHPRHMGKKLSDLPPGSVIGTSALRRAAQLQRKYPNFKIENIRGNLNTRFRKLSEDGSTYDAIILAVSGLERMNWHHLISEVLTPEDCMHAVSQGALAVECRAGDVATLSLLQGLNHVDTALAVVAERSFLTTLEGGCSVPVSVYTEKTDNQLMIRGGVFSICGTQAVKDEMTCDLLATPDEKLNEEADPPATFTTDEHYITIVCHEAENHRRYHNARCVGRRLALAMIGEGADVILKAAKNKTKEDVLEEHARRKRKAELAKEASASTSASAPKEQKVEQHQEEHKVEGAESLAVAAAVETTGNGV
ncbi:porphobilinogen deaminase-like [Babylonia areolata]|uniref:porphobilinogen deaminase-like n=1 Tax=Babylonia areolata TaxID=304850 RepID=UPI003FD0DB8A